MCRPRINLLSKKIKSISSFYLTNQVTEALIRVHLAQVAQSVEQGTENPRVGGSIPPLGTIIFQWVSPFLAISPKNSNLTGLQMGYAHAYLLIFLIIFSFFNCFF